MRIIFVGVHFKEGFNALDSRTKSGKLIDRIIEKLDVKCLKTNIFSGCELPEKQLRKNHLINWKIINELNEKDVIIGLGTTVHEVFKDIKIIKLKHPSCIWSNISKDNYVNSAIIEINKWKL